MKTKIYHDLCKSFHYTKKGYNACVARNASLKQKLKYQFDKNGNKILIK